MTIGRWTRTVVLGLILGLVAGWLGLLLGSSKVIQCGSGNVLDRIAEDLQHRFGAGHVDGATQTGCYVPSTSAWIFAASALAVVLAKTIAVSWLLARHRSDLNV